MIWWTFLVNALTSLAAKTHHFTAEMTKFYANILSHFPILWQTTLSHGHHWNVYLAKSPLFRKPPSITILHQRHYLRRCCLWFWCLPFRYNSLWITSKLHLPKRYTILKKADTIDWRSIIRDSKQGKLEFLWDSVSMCI